MTTQVPDLSGNSPLQAGLAVSDPNTSTEDNVNVTKDTSTRPTGTSADQVQGNLAHDAVDSGNPVKIGGIATNAVPTAVSAGDRVNAWFSVNGAQFVSIVDGAGTGPSIGTGGADALAAGNGITVNSQGKVWNGASFDRLRGDTNGAVVQSGLSSTFWNYAGAASGIVNTTTAVTLKAAAGASVRNYLKSLQIDHDALGAATEIAIRDDAGGTVLWRGKLPTGEAHYGRTIIFDPPLKGTANKLMEFVTLTASVTGGVFVNAQGFTGA